MDECEKGLQTQDAANTMAVESEVAFVTGEITRCLEKLKNESKELEANVQLDKNLEHRGRSEFNVSGDLSQKAQDYVNHFTEEISNNLADTSSNIQYGIGGVAIFIFFAISAYKMLSL